MNENKLSDLLYEIYEQDLPALEHEKNIENILSIFKQWNSEEEKEMLEWFLKMIGEGSDAKSLIELQLQSGKYMKVNK